MSIATPVKEAQLCSVTLLGNLVSKPEIRYQANPVQATTELTLATHTKWLDKKTNSTKEWTSYHHIKVVGDMVEQSLMHAQKGDIILVHGYLAVENGNKETVNASFVQCFPKGYTQAINQINCSATLTEAVTLVKTENNKELAHTNISITLKIYSNIKQTSQFLTIKRAVHVWGKQAKYLNEHAQIGDNLLIEGKLNYLNDAEKAQFIEAKMVQLIKK